MKKHFFLPLALLCGTFLIASADPGANIRLTDVSLMHESRDTPYPTDGWVENERAVSFQWPMPVWARGKGAPLDGMEHTVKKVDKSKLHYKLRYSTDKTFPAGNTTAVETIWPFYNPAKPLAPGKWYWQYAYVNEDGTDQWSPVYSVTVSDNKNIFAPPSFDEFIAKLPTTHPRILVDAAHWDEFIENAKDKPEYQWYIDVANKALETPMKRVEDIRTDAVANLDTPMKRKAYLTRESRRIIDAEESTCDGLIRAYLLTKGRRYADEAIRRITTMFSWGDNPNVQGDFNDGAIVSIASMAYDSFYNLLTPEQKKLFLEQLKGRIAKMYAHYNNYLENHIAENHLWQMNFRITSLAVYATYGDYNESKLWADYCYNVWLCRFPGLNRDGAWHNGDSYFTVNTRTLVEMPWFYSRVTGYDFFSDPWYDLNTLYTMYHCPPFQKSAGNGSSHQNVGRPNAIRIGYLDAMARIRNNSIAADFVRRTLAKEPEYLKKAHLSKPGDLSWFRLSCDKPLPTGPGLTALMPGYTFPESGLASSCSNWDVNGANHMWSFRSSPYGSTSHAISNQNAFNTFYGGRPVFYSSGHHTSFTDRHSILCHRASRAHNTILPDGMNQRIGVEGYGWIPRYYNSDKINYVLGDASNAYGNVISPLWLERAEQSDVKFDKENGWDENHVKTFRRHLVDLGNTGWILVYDELEADKPVSWHYLLHSVAGPIEVDTTSNSYVHISTVNRGAKGDAFLFSSGKLQCDTTDQFFVPAVNWLKGDAKGNFKKYPNHHHFTAKSEKAPVYRYAALINTHALKHPSKTPEIRPDGRIRVPGWLITVNLSTEGKPSFRVEKEGDEVIVNYQGEETIIDENGYVTTLTDQVPNLEI